MKTQIKTEVEMITPNNAKEYLKKANPNNRNIRQTVVSTYARDMRGGKWKANGETIIFDRNGMLQNGHHRLHAVIESGCNILFNVCRGVDPDCMVTYDMFSTRSKDQILQMEGLVNATVLAAAARLSLIYKNGIMLNNGDRGSWNTNYKATMSEIRDECVNNNDTYQWAVKISAQAKIQSKGMFNQSNLVFLYVTACNNWKNKERLEVFAEKIAYGNSLDLNDPELVLRNMANRHRENKRDKVNSNYIRNAIIYAWNASFEGRKISMIKLQDPHKILKVLV